MTKVVFFISLFFAFIMSSLATHSEGNLASRGTRLPDMKIDSQNLVFSQKVFEIETGKYYRWRISHDGYEEMQLVASEFFRNVWVDQIVINDLEVQPMGMHSVEFDDAGIMDIWFVPVRTGNFNFWIKGYRQRGLEGVFKIR